MTSNEELKKLIEEKFREQRKNIVICWIELNIVALAMFIYLTL